MIKFLLLSLFTFVNSQYSNCDYQDVYEIRNENDIFNINNCTSFNGSIFINTEYNVDNLNGLSNLKNINGYLLIWNSHNLSNLMGLNNLENVYGNTLYLNNYFLYIIDNHNLCYVNTVDWTKLNPINSYRVALNKPNCPTCDSLCSKCWDQDNCQTCKYFISGFTCVEQCPVGTDIEQQKCIEFIPFQPENLNIINLNYTKKNITWEPPAFPNGVILGYNFYLDDIFMYSGLNKFYVLDNLELNTIYNLKVNVFNSEGNSTNSSIILEIGNGLPEIPYNINYQIKDQNITFTWLSDGSQFYYQFLEGPSNMINNNNIYFDNLNFYTNYSIRFKAQNIYGESNFSEWINFTSYEYYPKTPLQPELSLYNLLLNIRFKPDYPINGKILNYNFYIYQNNNLYFNQSTNKNNINISTNYYKNYEINYNLTNKIGTSNISNSSYISTPIGTPLIPSIPRLVRDIYLTVIISSESDVNGPITNYQILMYNQSEVKIIYNNSEPGNVTITNITSGYVYEFQSKVFTSPLLYSLSEKISYHYLGETTTTGLSDWMIFLIVILCLILLAISIAISSYCHKKHLNKIADEIVVNQTSRGRGIMNPAYENQIPPIRRSPNPLYNKNTIRTNTESQHYYSEVDRNIINNPNYEPLYTPSNPPDISIPKNMLKE